jgi:hypothetical protein
MGFMYVYPDFGLFIRGLVRYTTLYDTTIYTIYTILVDTEISARVREAGHGRVRGRLDGYERWEG